MPQNKKHLNFDLGFLDKSDKKGVAGYAKSVSRADKSNKNNNILNAFKHNWQKVLIIGGACLFFIWVFSSSSGSDNSKTDINSTNSNLPSISQTINYTKDEDDTVIVGEYRCLIYHANKAEELKPSDLVSRQIDSEQQRLDSLAIQIENLADEIQGTYVNEYSQYSVDNYNSMVDTYNIQLEMYQQDADALDRKINQYNISVDKYNNYLETNCTKVR